AQGGVAGSEARRRAARPSAVRARDQRARRIRRRRRPARLDEAGRLGRGRGRHGSPPGPPLPGDGLMTVEELRGMPLMTGLGDDQLAALAAAGEEVAFVPGDELFRGGRPADVWWLLLDGTLELVRQVGSDETVVGQMD